MTDVVSQTDSRRGSAGAYARAAALTPEQRTKIASYAAWHRWKRMTLKERKALMVKVRGVRLANLAARKVVALTATAGAAN